MSKVLCPPVNGTTNPLVSVLMTVFNGVPYLQEAVKSILEQSFTDFEFLIVDNASTDSSLELLRSFDDSRIRIIENSHNIGPPRALNKALKIARGTYIARMDADDIAIPDRLAKQVQFVRSHPDVAVLGTERRIIDHRGTPQYTPPLPISENDLHWRILFTSPIAHSSVLMKRSAALENGGYDEDFRHAADYDLWSRLFIQGRTIANLPNQLMEIRSHPGSDGNSASQELLTLEVARVSQQNVQAITGLTLDYEHVVNMIRLLTRFQSLSPYEALEGLYALQMVGKASGGRTNSHYGRTLMSLGLASRHLSTIRRLALMIKGLTLVGGSEIRQRHFSFFKTWVLSGLFLGALSSRRRRQN